MQEEVLPLKKVAEAMGAEALLIDHRHPMATLCLAYNHTHAGMPHSRTPAYWHTYCVANTPMAYAVISNHWHRLADPWRARKFTDLSNFCGKPAFSRLEHVSTSDAISDVYSACCMGDFLYGVEPPNPPVVTLVDRCVSHFLENMRDTCLLGR